MRDHTSARLTARTRLSVDSNKNITRFVVACRVELSMIISRAPASFATNSVFNRLFSDTYDIRVENHSKNDLTILLLLLLFFTAVIFSKVKWFFPRGFITYRDLQPITRRVF